ncbi:MAG: DUF4388 domain-containing protein, partial [Bacteroidetes bacterium]|nr:DUF4388 domain-containing protein [Bacteroidota bacterium]
VIIMTAYGSAEVQKEASARGSLHYIEKPFEIEELRQLILKALKEKKGFDGKVSDFQLSDLIQMNVLGRMMAALVVTKGDEKGSVFFNEGAVVHAECGDLVGEEAFYKIISWDTGKFEFHKGEQTDKATIRQGWQSLLLEGMRRKDEVTPESKTQMKEFSRQESQEKIKAVLSEFIKIKGVEAVAIIDTGGFAMASLINDKSEKPVDLTTLANFIPDGMKYLENVSEEVKGNMVRLITLEFDHRTLMLSSIGQRKEWLIFYCEPDVSLGALRFALKKQTSQLEATL